MFLLCLAEGLAITTNSNFLLPRVGENGVPWVYAGASLVALLGLLVLPELVAWRGRGRVLSAFLLLGAAAASATAWLDSPWLVLGFVAYLAVPQVAPAISDLYLEVESRPSWRGRVVGSAYTLQNLAYVLGPLAGGYLIGRQGFGSVYALAGLTFLVAFLLLRTFARFVPNIHLRPQNLVGSIRHAWRNRDVRDILGTYLLLQFFFSWMIIYTPLYLVNRFNFSFATLGLIFSIMLLPYVLLEYILGWIADTRLGEKEILVAGFVIMAATTGVIIFIQSSLWWVWAMVLFATRVGAAAVESMTATYFQKKVRPSDVDLTAFFRNMRPLGYLIGPLLASLVVTKVSLPALFPILSMVMLAGAFLSLRLRDTR